MTAYLRNQIITTSVTTNFLSGYGRFFIALFPVSRIIPHLT